MVSVAEGSTSIECRVDWRYPSAMTSDVVAVLGSINVIAAELDR